MTPVVTFWNKAPRDYMAGLMSDEALRDVPCAYWLKTAREAGWLNTAECLERIERGDDPKSFLLLSEERNADSEKLLALGVTPFICFSFESPLYVPEFYADTVWWAQFENYWAPMPFVPEENYAFLPNYGPQKGGKGVCAFASGKHWAELRGPWDNAQFCSAFGGQLLQERWMQYYFAAKRGHFTLYGNGWNPRPLPGLPKDFWETVIPCVRAPSPYSHKFEQMRSHMGVISIENWNGYATEKAFDAPKVGIDQIYIGQRREPVIKSIVDTVNQLMAQS